MQSAVEESTDGEKFGGNLLKTIGRILYVIFIL
jgi:hypothetical protein